MSLTLLKVRNRLELHIGIYVEYVFLKLYCFKNYGDGNNTLVVIVTFN